MGLLTDRINNRLEKSNFIYEHALNREHVPNKQFHPTLFLIHHLENVTKETEQANTKNN